MLEELREFLWKKAYLVSKVVPEKETDPAAAKYSDYFDYDEPIETVPSHRALAVFRGRQEGLLTIKVLLTEEEDCPRAWHQESRTTCRRLAGRRCALVLARQVPGFR